MQSHCNMSVVFSANMVKTEYCQVLLTEEKLKAFMYAVKNHYWYQMYMDDLPIWGIVGEMENEGNDLYIWTHKRLDIGFNKDQVSGRAIVGSPCETKARARAARRFRSWM